MKKRLYLLTISMVVCSMVVFLLYLTTKAQDSQDSENNGSYYPVENTRYKKLNFETGTTDNSSGLTENPTKVCDYGLIPQYSAGSLGGHASTVLGDTLYIAGGMDTIGTFTNRFARVEVTRYAINSGEWSSGRDMPGPKTGGDLVACNGALYYIGGGGQLTTTGLPTNTTYKYTPGAGWTTVANIPTPVVGNVAECWGDSVIFCIAGGWNTYITTIQVYRPATDSWSTSTSLPGGTGRRSFAGGLDGNKIFVAAGYDGGFRKDFLIGTIGADANTITWTTGAEVPMRGTGNSRPGGHAVNGRFYVVLGETTPGPIAQDSIVIYDIGTDQWLPERLTGRGANSASNYWGCISSSIINDKVRIWIPGGFYPTTVVNTKLMVLTDSIDCEITGVNPVSSIIPNSFTLDQNYPNPFNPTTKIRFEIPGQGKLNVKLSVYNSLGEEVDVILNENISAGVYEATWDGGIFASGIYYYRLSTDNFTETKKMTLLK